MASSANFLRRIATRHRCFVRPPSLSKTYPYRFLSPFPPPPQPPHSHSLPVCFSIYRAQHVGISRRALSSDAPPQESSDFSAKGAPEAADSHNNPEQGGDNEDAKGNQRTEGLDEKTQVLQAALSHVPKLGWSEAAMVAGARDVGLSPAIIGAFPRKEAALVEFFMDESLQKLLDTIETQEDETSKMVLRERIVRLVRLRLEMQAPFISHWAQALSIQAYPANLPSSFKQRAVLMDEIWHAAGDRSSDVDWYAKRGTLAAVYTATELYMLTDYSPSFRESWSFLERRVKDVVDCRKTAQEAAQIAQAIGAGFGSTLQSLFRR